MPLQTNTKKQYRAVVIGCGARAPEHIDAYELIDNAEVVACCAPSGTRRDPLAQHYGIHAYSDPEEMLQQELPDMVHIITAADVRTELMQLVAKYEIPLCTAEKPLATGVADWHELKKLEASSITKFGICHQFRWHPYLMQCREALIEETMGEIQLLDMSSRMNLSAQGTHSLNYGMFLNGDSPAIEVFGNSEGWDTSDPMHHAPKSTTAQILFENGTRGLWNSGSFGKVIDPKFPIWKHKRVTAYTTCGQVNWEQFGNSYIHSTHLNEQNHCGDDNAIHENHKQAQAGFHKAMFHWLENENAEPGVSLTHSLHEWKIVLALYQSALEGRSIKLDVFDPPLDLIDSIQNP